MKKNKLIIMGFLSLIFFSGCAHQVKNKTVNPNNTTNSYSQEIGSQQYALEHRCSNSG